MLQNVTVEDVVEVLAAVHVIALFVVNLTPTPKDDAFVAKAYGVVQVLAGLVTRKSTK